MLLTLFLRYTLAGKLGALESEQEKSGSKQAPASKMRTLSVKESREYQELECKCKAMEKALSKTREDLQRLAELEEQYATAKKENQTLSESMAVNKLSLLNASKNLLLQHKSCAPRKN